jgi:hypothetical protein
MHGQHDDFGINKVRAILRVASRPPIPGMFISISTTSAEFAAPFYGIFATARLTGNFNTFNIFKNASYPCAHQFVVINKKDVDQRKCLQNRDNATE